MLQVLVAAVWALPASAQTRNTSSVQLDLVRATCPGDQPCDPNFLPVNGLAFIHKVRQPHLVSDRELGSIKVSLRRLGEPPIPTFLEAQVSGTIFYGADAANGAVCSLANTTVANTTFATSTVNCFVVAEKSAAKISATCTGTLFFVDLTAPECSDVAVHIQNPRIDVYEGGFGGESERRIATSGGARRGKLPLIQAYCTTGPCDPRFTFMRGRMKTAKGRRPSLSPEKWNASQIRIDKLQGVEISPSLEARLSGTIVFGNDPSASCPLANTVSSGPFATATMTCRTAGNGNGDCAGHPALINPPPPACADVEHTIQNLEVEVYEGGFIGVEERRIASGGIQVLGKSPDCASGGAGCP